MHGSPAGSGAEPPSGTDISGMDGGNDVSMVDADGVRDPPPPHSCGYALGESVCTDAVPELSEATVEMDGNMAHKQPQSSSTRTRSQSAGSSALDPLDGGERGRVEGTVQTRGW